MGDPGSEARRGGDQVEAPAGLPAQAAVSKRHGPCPWSLREQWRDSRAAGQPDSSRERKSRIGMQRKIDMLPECNACGIHQMWYPRDQGVSRTFDKRGCIVRIILPATMTSAAACSLYSVQACCFDMVAGCENDQLLCGEC